MKTYKGYFFTAEETNKFYNYFDENGNEIPDELKLDKSEKMYEYEWLSFKKRNDEYKKKLSSTCMDWECYCTDYLKFEITDLDGVCEFDECAGDWYVKSEHLFCIHSDVPNEKIEKFLDKFSISYKFGKEIYAWIC